jgi:hypothetical protein
LTDGGKDGQNWKDNVPAVDATDNSFSRDALGNKADTARMTSNSAYSAMSYLRGLITMGAKPAQDSSNNVYPADVIGSKDDTARIAAANTYSLVGYAKGIISQVATILTDVTKPAADSANNLTPADVIGAKDDASYNAVATTKSLMAYIKAILSDQLVVTADTTNNITMSNGVGNKTDAAVVAVGTTKSIMAYVKGLVTMHTKPSADSTNNVYPSDVIGSKDDAAQATVGTTRSLMAYIKAILNAENKGWAMQADATLAQATPAQNTWYDILTAANGVNARVYSVGIRVNTTGETLEVRFIVDGQTWTVSAGVACTAAAEYYARRVPATGGTATGYVGIGATEVTVTLAGFMDGKSTQISVRKTTASGTGTLYGRVIWAKMV